MNRHSDMVSDGSVSIETYIDGDRSGPDVVVLPSYGRDGGADSDRFAAAPRSSRTPATPFSLNSPPQ